MPGDVSVGRCIWMPLRRSSFWVRSPCTSSRRFPLGSQRCHSRALWVSASQWLECAPTTALVVALALGTSEAPHRRSSQWLRAVHLHSLHSILCPQQGLRGRGQGVWVVWCACIYSGIFTTTYGPLLCISALFASAWSMLLAYA